MMRPFFLRRRPQAAGWALPLLLAASPLAAGDFSGEVRLETRGFTQSATDPAQTDFYASAGIELEYYHDWDDGNQRFAFTPFVRAGQHDDERTHADIQELYWRKTFAAGDLYVGVRKVFWGVTESLHLVDIVNQTDLVENLDAEDKLGQPMVQWSWLKDWGTLDVFVMPYFRERTFAGREGRPRGPLVVDTDNAVYESSAAETHLDLAVRWSHAIGAFDIGLAHFSGTSREPRLMPGMNQAGEPVLIPHYDLLAQTSLDLQYTVGDWLWKLEAVSRDGHDGRSSAFVAGFEYTFVGARESAVDVGLVAEYQYDSRHDPYAPVGDNDLALGTRLTFNDVQDTNLLAVVGIDARNESLFFSLEGDRRLGTRWEIAVESRFFTDVDPRDPLAAFAGEDYVQIELIRYF